MAEIYQMRAVIKKISPIIYRRFLIQNDFSLAGLHYTLQILFGWSDTYLHQFKIHGKRYGVSRPSGIWFADNPNERYGTDSGNIIDVGLYLSKFTDDIFEEIFLQF